jgi:hypothetical protein
MEFLVKNAAHRLESEYDDIRLEKIIKNKGLEPEITQEAV